MGEVYRARDLKLGREVALKILPASFAADPDRVARFERESRVLAHLNHPNIATIYGREETPAGTALVLELVDGPTLAESVAGGPLAPREVIAIANQIVDALDAAHEKGIVHRDLKPSNIKRTAAQTVKVLDFGLAVPTASSDLSELPTMKVTSISGLVVGTPAYMSPEQARGLTSDKRTDVWAFGCVLYEMLSGRRAFTGATASDVVVSVLEREPDWNALPRGTPPHVVRLIRRCVEKNPGRRLRDIADARADLDVTPPGVLQADPAPRSLWLTRIAWAVPALAAGFLVAYVARRPDPPGATLSTDRIVAARLTSYSGQQSAAAISPDGRSFAFVSDHGGTPDVWLRQVSGGEPIRITNDAAEESELAFSGDGEEIYFTRVAEGLNAIWKVGTLGGEPRKVVSNAHSAAISPDGRRLAYMTIDKPGVESVTVSNIDGSNARAIAQHVAWFPPVRPAWSPDGRQVTFSRAGLFAPSNLFAVNMETGVERQVTHIARSGVGVGQAAWLPDNQHLVASYNSSGGTQPASDLAIVDAQAGTVGRLTAAINESFVAPTISRDGSRLVATSVGYTRELWRVPLNGSSAEANGNAATRLIDGASDPMWSYVTRDDALLLFNSTASGNRNLWLMPLATPGPPRQITSIAADAVSHSSLSPDGKRVAFISFASGVSHVWTQNIDGSDLRQITTTGDSHSWPVWSPDGRFLVYSEARGGDQQTWIAASDGTSAHKLVDGFFRGDWVEKPGTGGTWIVTSDGTDSIRLIDVDKAAVVWKEQIVGSGSALPMFSPDRRLVSVAYRQDRNRGGIMTIDVATRERRVAAILPFQTIFRAAWVDRGRALIVNRSDTFSHTVLFDHVWGPTR